METGGFATGMLGILGLSGGELVLVLILILILFGANRIPPFARGRGEGFNGFRRSSRGLSQEIGESLGAGLGKPVADALTHSNQTWEFQDPPALRLRSIKKQMKNNFILWIAQGFGVGRIPFAAGTFGSLVGLLWFVVLLLPGNVCWCVVGAGAGIFLSVWLCGSSERILNQTDPGSVVLDEIIAVPLCFLVWIGEFLARHGAIPGPSYFFHRDTWPLTLAVFAAFRFFDIVKPWPVRQSQRLPGGWGVTMDDVLAALYVNVVSAIALLVPSGR